MLREYIICLIFCLLSFSCGCFCNPVPDKSLVFEYNYEGRIDTRTSADPDYLARWTFRAKVSQVNFLHENLDLVFVKMQDIKTGLFNGQRDELLNFVEKRIPEEAKILEQPFALNFSNDFSFTLMFKPNEPLWSMNIKRGIANQIKFEYEKPEILSNGEYASLTFPIEDRDEKNLFGDCPITYTRKSATVKDGVFFEKTSDNFNCTNGATVHTTNRQYAPGIKGFSDIADYRYSKILHIMNIHDLKSYHTKANIVFRTSPSAPYTLHIDQELISTFVGQHEPKETIDPKEYTNEHQLQYVIEDDPYLGRHTYEEDPEKLAKKYIKHEAEFKKAFEYASVDKDTETGEALYDMYETLESMDVEGLKKIQKHVTASEKKGEFDSGFFFLSLLSYIGSDESIKYLTDFYKTEKVNADVGFSTWTLMNFPQYIQYPSKEMLESMEGLMANPDSNYKMTKNAAVFGFAKAVTKACKNEMSDQKYWQKYIDMFNKKYLDGQNYEERMVYLLGLVNMAPCLGSNLVNSVLTNSTESSELRLLAFIGFTNYLKNFEYPNKIYDTYWPIVQKKSEPFEIRVAALNLLLSVQLSKEQFNTILQRYSENQSEPEDMQLANYVITSLHSIQNTTGYIDNLGEMASEAIKKSNIRSYPKSWATGRYRLSYTDSVPNVGVAFEAGLITDPKTNIINTIVISFNSFGNSFDYGTYTLYFRIKGIIEQAYVTKFLDTNKTLSIPQLLKLLKENNFELKTHEEDVHVDLVIYAKDIAVYASHFENFGKDQVDVLTADIKNLIGYSNYISIPLIDIVHVPSIFGTPIFITNYMINAETHNYGHDRFNLRFSKNLYTWLEAYNPLVDANIAVYKYNVDETSLKLNFSTKTNIRAKSAFTWLNEDESITHTWDNNMGTTVLEEDKLKEYCDKCIFYKNHDTNKEFFSSKKTIEPFGVEFEIESHKHSNISSSLDVLGEFIVKNEYRFNVDAAPIVGPFALAADCISYIYWVRSDLTNGFIKSRPANSDKTTRTFFNINLFEDIANKYKSLAQIELKTDVIVKTLEDNILSKANLSYSYTWDPDFVAENATKRSGIALSNFYFVYNSPSKNNSFKICGSEDIRLPHIRSDRFSLVPYEPSTGEIIVHLGKNVDDDRNCVPLYTYAFTEVYSTTDKNGSVAKKRMQKDYEKCLSDSKDLEFTAPTKECRRVADWLTEYDNYKVYMELTKHLEDRNKTIIPKSLFLEYSRIDEDKLHLKLSFIRFLLEQSGPEFEEYEVYYPHMIVNPARLSYSDDIAITPDTISSTCFITPSKIEQFSGKLVPNQNNKWLAFGECFNVSKRGLNGHTVDDKYVGFTFYAYNIVVEATVKGGTINLTLNGKPLTENYNPEDLSLLVYFLDKDNKAVYIKDGTVELYYNTEYIHVKVDAAYPQLLCGVCVPQN